MKYPRIRSLVTTLFLTAAFVLPFAGEAFASTSPVYNAIPSTLPGNMASLGFQATQTAQFGDYVHLGGTNRVLDTVTITMSDWALASTSANVTFCSASVSNCDSTGFFWPITINVYSNHLTGGVPDTLLATKTVRTHIPWRPVADPTCAGGTAWRSPSDSQCYNGFAFNAAFDMSALRAVLPSDVIVGIAYNTQTWGASPVGIDGPYNSLNVGVEGSATVGADQSLDNVFWNTSTAGYYTDGGAAGVGVFRQDTLWSPDGTVAMEITAGPYPITNGSNGYTTIQAAVNAATPGNTITVAAGTYAEHVTINKALTINGANAGLAGTSTSRTSESIVDGTDTGEPFVISANNVTINGFTVTRGDGGSLNSGIYSTTGTQNFNILNNIITNNDFGVWAQCGGNCLIQGNLFDGNNKPGPGSDSISADSTTGLTINSNEFKNDQGNPILLQAAIGGPTAHTNLAITNNYFHDASSSDVYVLALDGGTFAHNVVIPAADSTGFRFGGGDRNITVTGNTISNGARGVKVVDDGYGFVNTNGNISVNNNVLSGNTNYGVGNEDTHAGVVHATNNFWGSASGPNATSTPILNAGTGSPAVGNVSFSPWFTDAAMTSLEYHLATSSSGGNTVANSGGSTITLMGTSTSNGNDTITTEIPVNTTITGNASWDGTITPPTATTQTVTLSGFDTVVGSAVTIGSSQSDLTFDKAVKLTFAGQTGQHIGWYNHAGVFTEITDTCVDNTQVTNDLMAAGASCKFDTGTDMVVWTKHFSTFVTYTQTAVVSSGGGGGGGGGIATGPLSIGFQNTSGTGSTVGVGNGGTGGQVLGASTFNFDTNMGYGSRGANVSALHQVLIDAGYLKIAAPTGWFGPLTLAAVKKYQAAHGITTTGFVGVLTRAQLNK